MQDKQVPLIKKISDNKSKETTSPGKDSDQM